MLKGATSEPALEIRGKGVLLAPLILLVATPAFFFLTEGNVATVWFGLGVAGFVLFAAFCDLHLGESRRLLVVSPAAIEYVDPRGRVRVSLGAVSGLETGDPSRLGVVVAGGDPNHVVVEGIARERCLDPQLALPRFPRLAEGTLLIPGRFRLEVLEIADMVRFYLGSRL